MERVVQLPLTRQQRCIHHKSRFIEIDILRSIAIVSMIFLHILWDLDYFGIHPLNHQIYRFQFVIPALFFLLIGICLVITSAKKEFLFNHKHKLEKHLLLRGLMVLGLGMVFTAITSVFITDRPIFFGVLHCIGVSIILCIPLLRFRSYNILIASVIIISGIILWSHSFHQPTLAHLILGFHPADISQYTIDYFPLLPWFGVVLFGVGLGNILYKDGRRQFPFPDVSRYKSLFTFSKIGKHSLAIYVLHQPVIVGILQAYLVFSRSFPSIW